MSPARREVMFETSGTVAPGLEKRLAARGYFTEDGTVGLADGANASPARIRKLGIAHDTSVGQPAVSPQLDEPPIAIPALGTNWSGGTESAGDADPPLRR